MRTALLCSWEKDDALLGLAKFLSSMNWHLLGSAGSAKFLNDKGIPCRDVSDIVGPPILGHRVVTLAREIHAGLLSRDEDADELKKLNVPRIDLVYVTLYPLEKTITDPKSTPQDVIEKTDIGGPTLLRAAAKGRRIVISDPSQIPELEQLLEKGDVNERELEKLASAAERKVSEYSALSASYWEARSS